ncbi:hypothetical protein AB0M83_13065 [Amycolatopsis sp. NPDC051106]|uniref:hypothetical protein n=1 Tax=unclassified Amycolatopsis TaxID=2618356 RepID=UPI00341E0986
MTTEGPSTLYHLTWAYQVVRDAWHALSMDQQCDESAPWDQWEPLEGPDESAGGRTRLLVEAEISANNAVRGVLHHLRSLAMIYPPDALQDSGLHPNGWPGFAAFTLARTLLEGTALAAWLLPADPGERLYRSARFHLWSACEQRSGGATIPPDERGSVEYTQRLAKDAGFDVRPFGKDYGHGRNIAIYQGGQPKPFHSLAPVRCLIDVDGKSLYHQWSATAHYASWAHQPWTSLSLARGETGLLASTLAFEDKHVELAADVSSIVREAGNAVGTYYGRKTESFADRLEQVETHLRTQIPTIRRQLGRPDADPTASAVAVSRDSGG